MNAGTHVKESRIEAKKSLRQKYKTVALQSYQHENVHAGVARNLLSLLPEKVTVAVFMPLPDEPHFVGDLMDSKKALNLCFPRLVEGRLEFVVAKSFDGFVSNQYGIAEPPASMASINCSQIDVILVPGLAFDLRCQRLGRGQGYYDKTLAEFDGLKVGVCSSGQVTADDLPVEPHDMSMDLIVTEKFILKRVKNSGVNHG